MLPSSECRQLGAVSRRRAVVLNRDPLLRAQVSSRLLHSSGPLQDGRPRDLFRDEAVSTRALHLSQWVKCCCCGSRAPRTARRWATARAGGWRPRPRAARRRSASARATAAGPSLRRRTRGSPRRRRAGAGRRGGRGGAASACRRRRPRARARWRAARAARRPPRTRRAAWTAWRSPPDGGHRKHPAHVGRLEGGQLLAQLELHQLPEERERECEHALRRPLAPVRRAHPRLLVEHLRAVIKKWNMHYITIQVLVLVYKVYSYVCQSHRAIATYCLLRKYFQAQTSQTQLRTTLATRMMQSILAASPHTHTQNIYTMIILESQRVIVKSSDHCYCVLYRDVLIGGRGVPLPILQYCLKSLFWKE